MTKLQAIEAITQKINTETTLRKVYNETARTSTDNNEIKQAKDMAYQHYIIAEAYKEALILLCSIDC